MQNERRPKGWRAFPATASFVQRPDTWKRIPGGLEISRSAQGAGQDGRHALLLARGDLGKERQAHQFAGCTLRAGKGPAGVLGQPPRTAEPAAGALVRI